MRALAFFKKDFRDDGGLEIFSFSLLEEPILLFILVVVIDEEESDLRVYLILTLSKNQHLPFLIATLLGVVAPLKKIQFEEAENGGSGFSQKSNPQNKSLT